MKKGRNIRFLTATIEPNWDSQKRQAVASPPDSETLLSRPCTNLAAGLASGACFVFFPSEGCRSQYLAARWPSNAILASPKPLQAPPTTSAVMAGDGKSISA